MLSVLLCRRPTPYCLYCLYCRDLVDVATQAGFTPLMYAAWGDHAEAAAALMELGAKTHHRNWSTDDPTIR